MRLVLALPQSVEDALLAPLMAARHEIVARPAAAVELESVIDSLRPDAVLVHSSPRSLAGAVVAAADRVGARILAFADTSAELALAAELGVLEVISTAAAWPEIQAMLEGESLAPVEKSEPKPRGRVIGVWGPTGAPGRTTTAIGLAAELVRAGCRVALVDADPFGGAVAPMLGLLDEAPGFAAACRLAGSDGLDLAQLDRIASPVPVPGGRLAVLTGLTRPSRWTELSAPRVDAALEVMRDWVDVVVVDTGFSLETDEEIMSDVHAPRRNAATLTVLERSDRVVAVGSADAVSLARLLRGHSELTDLVPAERVDVVVNRVRRGSLGLDARGQVAASLARFGGFTPAAFLPHEPNAYDAALVRAEPVTAAAPRSDARQALVAYATEHLLPLVSGAVPTASSAPVPAAASPGRRRRRTLAFR